MITFRSVQRTTNTIHKALLGIDVENNPKTGKFINAALYGYVKNHHGRERIVDEFFTSKKKLQQYLMGLRKEGDKNIPCLLVFFNASYDYWFLSAVTDDAVMLSSGTRIISGKLKNGIPMIDLTNIVDGTLESWIKELDMEEKFGIKKESFDNLEKRVRSDARATYELGHFIENFFVYEVDIPLKLTIASAARYAFARHFFKDFWFRKESDYWKNTYERDAYRGGRVEVYRRGKLKVLSYDLNSDYLSVMQKHLIPDPNTAKWHSGSKDFDINMEKLFIADVTVNVPDTYIPPLPYKENAKADAKLLFPVGTFRGKYCSPELVNAVKNGVKILMVHSYMTYTGKYYFREFANFIWGKRKEYKAKKLGGMDRMIKKLGNSLYGSFGQRNSDNSYFGKTSDYNEVLDENDDVRPVTIEGIKYISVQSGTKTDSNHTFPCIPAFITSYARVDLYDGLKVDEEGLVYTDTDCRKGLSERGEPKKLNIGKELGEWGFEYEKEQWFYRGKLYGDKNKGIPERADLIYSDQYEKTFAFKRPNKMKESIKRNLMPNRWDYCVKVVSLMDDKREWSKNGLISIPIKIFFGERVEVDKSKNRVWYKEKKKEVKNNGKE